MKLFMKHVQFFEFCQTMINFLMQLDQLFASAAPTRSTLNSVHESLTTHTQHLVDKFMDYPEVLCPYLWGTVELEHELLHEALLQEEAGNSLQNHFNPLFWLQADGSQLKCASKTISDLLTGSSTPLPPKLQRQLVHEALFIDSVRPGYLKSTLLQWLRMQWTTFYQSLLKKKDDLIQYKVTKRRQRQSSEAEDEQAESEDGEVGVDLEMMEVRGGCRI